MKGSAYWAFKVEPGLSFMFAADEIPVISSADASSMLDSQMKPEEINNNRFHMLSGICIEALCTPFVSYSEEDTGYCLSSVEALLDTSIGRERLTLDKVRHRTKLSKTKQKQWFRQDKTVGLPGGKTKRVNSRKTLESFFSGFHVSLGLLSAGYATWYKI